MHLNNERVGDLSELVEKADSLQLPVLQTPEDVDRCKARRFVDGHVLPKPSCFLTPMRMSYLRLVNAPGNFKMMIFTINHVFGVGGVWAVGAVMCVCIYIYIYRA